MLKKFVVKVAVINKEGNEKLAKFDEIVLSRQYCPWLQKKSKKVCYGAASLSSASKAKCTTVAPKMWSEKKNHEFGED